jgi:hypothetical protein
MSRMTLHDAIDAVLESTRVPTSTRDVANLINARRLYVRRSDGGPVEAKQIAARVRLPTYRDRYVIDDEGRISLV